MLTGTAIASRMSRFCRIKAECPDIIALFVM